MPGGREGGREGGKEGERRGEIYEGEGGREGGADVPSSTTSIMLWTLQCLRSLSTLMYCCRCQACPSEGREGGREGGRVRKSGRCGYCVFRERACPSEEGREGEREDECLMRWDTIRRREGGREGREGREGGRTYQGLDGCCRGRVRREPRGRSSYTHAGGSGGAC